MKYITVLVLIMLFNQFSLDAKKINKIKLFDEQSTSHYVFDKNKQFYIIAFLSDICPICIYNFKNLKDTKEQFKDSSVQLIGILPNSTMNSKNVEMLKSNYQLNFNVYLDTKKQLTNKLHATITPEIFILNKNYHIIYSGKIDNAYEDISNRRWAGVINYLAENLLSLLKNDSIIYPSNNAVGCAIY